MTGTERPDYKKVLKSWKFFGIGLWYLSVFFITFFFVGFQSPSLYDAVFGHYSIQEMVVSNYEYSSSSKERTITVYGYIGKQAVYFSRFNYDIEKFRADNPEIFVELKKNVKLKVIKFKHSNSVKTVKDNEYGKWKETMFYLCSYIIISGIIMVIKRLFFKKRATTE